MKDSRIDDQGGPKSSFVDADGLRLRYLEWTPPQYASPAGDEGAHGDAGSPGDEIPIVILHGLGSSADAWRLVAPHLCIDHQVIAFDQRGHGHSDSPATGYDLVTLAEDAVRAMAALGLGQVALVGHGWGARVALVLAALHGALISHLVLVDCPHVEPRHWPGMTIERFLREAPPQDIYLSRGAFLSALRSEMAAFWSPEVESILLASVIEHGDGKIEERLRPAQQRLIRQALWDDRALSYYGKIRCPVLLVPAAGLPQPGGQPPAKLEHASEFAAAKGYMAVQVARIIPRCTILWMPDTAHDIQLHRPQRLAATISAFIQE
jgi:pimeloyl-ACP methyl ester carboxylesterase